jgi:5-methylthioadenosine/S-adenosylhomocysteine deaminase
VDTVLRLSAPAVIPCVEEYDVIVDGLVDIDAGGRITWVGPAARAPEVPPTATRRSLTGILLPGLINTHAHTSMTPLRGIGGDVALLTWLNDHIWPAEAKLRAADVRAGTLLGSLEMLSAGVTTSAEMYFHGQQVAEAVLATGARAVIGPAIIDLPNGPGWRQMLDEVNAWIDRQGRLIGPHDRIEVSYGAHSAYTLPVEALVATSEAAAHRGALVQIHVAESVAEDDEQRARHGSVPALLAEIGMLTGRVLAAHAVHLSDADIALFAEHGVGVGHCPGSNAKLASGTARVTELRTAGVAVGLGTDGPASNDDLDLWEELKLTPMLARLATGDPSAMTAGTALLMATRDGARALGRDDIGVLASGRWADLAHVDVDDPAFAAGLDVSAAQLVSNLVWAAGSRCVDSVWVAGVQVVADRRPTLVDRAEALADVRTVAARLRS